MQCFSSDWCDLRWSRWQNVTHATSTGRTPTTVPDAAGVYRIRSASLGQMVYIGECSDLSKRIPGTWARLNRRPARDFSSSKHAARRLAHLREAYGLEYEISFYAAHHEGRRDPRLDAAQWRKGLESRLLWEYRLQARMSSVANHRRSTVQEGEQLAGEGSKVGFPEVGFPYRIRPSSTPLPRPEREPCSELWMGKRWTSLAECKGTGQRIGWSAAGKELRESGNGTPVLYKVLDSSTHELLQVGYSRRGSAGALAAASRLAGEKAVAWAPLTRAGRQEHVLQELKDDLIGGYFYQMGKSPARQFSAESIPSE